MLFQLTIPKKQTRPLATDYQQLYEMGLEHIQQLASRIWTDYNVHDPGITTLELLCYALTDLSYRAELPIKDLLASATDNQQNMQEQFYTARQILPNRPLTLLDYRKLLIDIEGVQNAWISKVSETYYADVLVGELLRTKPVRPGIVDVHLAGLYRVTIEYANMVETPGARATVMQAVQAKLQANRNLCEDFVEFGDIQKQHFQLCAELELTPGADVTRVNQEIFWQVQQYLAPPVKFYSLSEMLQRQQADGNLYRVDEIFDGPALSQGFIDDRELMATDLRREIRLSDIISIIMDIDGVQALRDIAFNPAGRREPLPNKWIIPVEPNRQASLNLPLPVGGTLDPSNPPSRLVFYKRNIPVVAKPIGSAPSTPAAPPHAPNDLPIPLGTYRELDRYYSFQNHFPAIYGLSEAGLSSTLDDRRQALAHQLKAYLLFFDQIMANYFAQLSQVQSLFSLDPTIQSNYTYQVVNSFAEYEKIYQSANAIPVLQAENDRQEREQNFERRNKFLDHLIARFAERFHDFAANMYSLFDESPDNVIRYKCEFLRAYPTISSGRSLAYNHSLVETSQIWNTENVSGFEQRLAKLLGLTSYQRRDLSDQEEDGMFVIENILLRPLQNADRFLPICPDPDCLDCSEADPYSYRLNIILPAYSKYFQNFDFRKFAEEIIRKETPAHILPRICWIDRKDMAKIEELYQNWLDLRSGSDKSALGAALASLIEQLFAVKTVYPFQQLGECDSAEDTPKFILGQTSLGSEEITN
jgi:uncharacterized protein